MKTELIPVEDRLSNWFYSQINSEQKQESSFAQNLTRNVSKASLFALVAVRNYFFVPLSRQLPHPWAFVVGNMGAVTAFECWAGNQLIDDAYPSQTSLGAIFPKKEMSNWQRAANVGNVALSLISQLPSVYPAMQYNPGPGSIAAGLVVGAGGAIFPMRSTQLAIQRYFDRKGVDSSKQDAFVRLLRDNRQGFIAKTPQEKIQFIAALEAIQSRGNTPGQIREYLGHLLSITGPLEEDKLSTGAYLSTQAARVTGFALSCIYQYVIGVYTYTKTKENIWNNDVFAGGMAAAAVLSELYLTVICMTNQGGNFWQTITGINKNSVSQATVPGKLWPNTVTVLQTIGVGINLLSLGVSYVIWRDFFKDPVERTFFETTMCGAVFLLFQAALPQVINGGVEYLISSWGTKEEKDAILIASKYQYLADSIERLSPEDFNRYFLSLIPETVYRAPLEEPRDDLESGGSQKFQINSSQFVNPLKSPAGSQDLEEDEETGSLLHYESFPSTYPNGESFDSRMVRVTEHSDTDSENEY